MRRSRKHRKIGWRLIGFSLLLILLGAGPAWNLASGRAPLRDDWRTAARQSAGIAPAPAKVREAIVQVYAARAFAWRGAFGVHTWIAVKPTDAGTWTTYQVIGWRLRRGTPAVAIQAELPDRFWFGGPPELLAELRGDGVDAVIARIDQAARDYPWANRYTAWPGPNSNTFTAWIARRVPELRLDLPPTAIGKDWLGETTFAAGAPSGTGYQVSLLGVAGILAAVEEGLEVNIAGLTLGVDPLDLALKLPGFGRIGGRNTAVTASETLGTGAANE
ncbi:MAG: DUF3750 domain-containing protein [Alphaproteobacteria bacterium]|nr:DUF3750 domain-containing protein [Alphaproteobacteria bacterium]